ncbi:hypothetical protein FVE85_9693 [Porphyridium purpureum]|uniref:Uncharacterized protein n=1 Tax=Porphyridium purpureum TaxID=35688 RepID=A0A5J4YJQ2_PORPP|nr:hypothetical protein FVE85_9693 [Porphyridium purpureum]|eukprot:POR9661..scf246_12
MTRVSGLCGFVSGGGVVTPRPVVQHNRHGLCPRVRHGRTLDARCTTVCMCMAGARKDNASDLATPKVEWEYPLSSRHSNERVLRAAGARVTVRLASKFTWFITDICAPDSDRLLIHLCIDELVRVCAATGTCLASSLLQDHPFVALLEARGFELTRANERIYVPKRATSMHSRELDAASFSDALTQMYAGTGDHVCLLVSDIRVSMNFYSLFGFEPTLKFRTASCRSAWLRSPLFTIALELIELPPERRLESTSAAGGARSALDAQRLSLGLYHVSWDVTRVCTELQEFVDRIDAKSRREFGKTLPVLQPPKQQMLGALIAQVAILPRGLHRSRLCRTMTCSINNDARAFVRGWPQSVASAFCGRVSLIAVLVFDELRLHDDWGPIRFEHRRKAGRQFRSTC